VEQAVNQEEKKVDEALNQQEELKNLLNTLFDTQGVGA
jgi:hypothetical protein